MEKLGEGSYGTVWKVKQRKTNLIRAMKKITKNTNSKSETVNEIINEIELLKKGLADSTEKIRSSEYSEDI